MIVLAVLMGGEFLASSEDYCRCAYVVVLIGVDAAEAVYVGEDLFFLSHRYVLNFVPFVSAIFAGPDYFKAIVYVRSLCVGE